MHIIIADDEPLYIDVLKHAFSDFDFAGEISVAYTLKEYKELVAKKRPDMALLDLHLPDGKSTQVLTYPPESNPFPVVIISGSGDEKAAVEALKAGASDYIVKSEETFREMPHVVQRVMREWGLLQAHKRMEQELHESEVYSKTILESISTGFVIIDAESHKIVDANSVALALFDAPKEKVVGSICHNFICPMELGKCPVSDLGQRVDNSERVLLNVRGEKIPVLKTISSVMLGGRKYLLENFVDITARKRGETKMALLMKLEQEARGEAEMANRAKGDFLAIVSHELRTPLTIIMGWVWMLRSSELKTEEREYALEAIQRSMESQHRIIDDLIDLSAFSRGNLHLERKPLDLAALLNSIFESLRRLSDAHSIRLVSDIKGPVGVFGDANRLHQVFTNLLNNALQFTPDGGEICLRLRKHDGHALVEMQDNGKGIAPDFLPHVFDPFRQGENPLTRKHQGLGLGLAIVKNIVELHDGTVTVRSPGAGRGSVFSVDLPVIPWAAEESKNAALAKTDVAASQDLSGLRILVVEDDPDTRDLLQKLLARCGAQVETAASAADAMAAFDKQTPEILICDIAMPDEDGYSLIRRVRGLGGGRGAVPAMALTALTRQEDRTQALLAGFQMYLSKPVKPAELFAAVRSLAGWR
ncbi:MAG: response regulator [Elusimicrobia bacterium]|nr:response regulator [Elusimicrobiota bacterium]